MDKIEKIYGLLEKKTPTAADRDELEKLIGNDKELKELVNTYQQLGEIVMHSSHLSEEELAQYTLYKNGSQPDDNSIISRVPFIEQHLRTCSECSELFREFNSEYAEVNNFLSESIRTDKNAVADSKDLSRNMPASRYKAPRFAFASVLILGFIYLALYLISTFSTPVYYNDAAIGQDTQFSINRGRATENFQNSLKALEHDNYDQAIAYLQKDIKANPDDETIFYSYYIIGLSYLKTAEHSFMGLFPGYNDARAEKGASYLKQSIEKNNSGKFNNIKLNSYFYLAKASLMLKDKNSAKKYLNLVINDKGSKMEEAKILLGELE